MNFFKSVSREQPLLRGGSEEFFKKKVICWDENDLKLFMKIEVPMDDRYRNGMSTGCVQVFRDLGLFGKKKKKGVLVLNSSWVKVVSLKRNELFLAVQKKFNSLFGNTVMKKLEMRRKRGNVEIILSCIHHLTDVARASKVTKYIYDRCWGVIFRKFLDRGNGLGRISEVSVQICRVQADVYSDRTKFFRTFFEPFVVCMKMKEKIEDFYKDVNSFVSEFGSGKIISLSKTLVKRKFALLVKIRKYLSLFSKLASPKFVFRVLEFYKKVLNLRVNDKHLGDTIDVDELIRRLDMVLLVDGNRNKTGEFIPKAKLVITEIYSEKDTAKKVVREIFSLFVNGTIKPHFGMFHTALCITPPRAFHSRKSMFAVDLNSKKMFDSASKDTEGKTLKRKTSLKIKHGEDGECFEIENEESFFEMNNNEDSNFGGIHMKTLTVNFQSIVQKLSDCIYYWNCKKNYNNVTCNCQHFVDDLMENLGIEEILSEDEDSCFSKFFESLRKGKSELYFRPSPEFCENFGIKWKKKKFESHQELDVFVQDILVSDRSFETTFEDEYLFLKALDRSYWIKWNSYKDKKHLIPLSSDDGSVRCPFKSPFETMSFV